LSGWAITLPYPPSENAFRSSRVVFSKKRNKLISLIHETHEAKNYKKDVAKLMATLGRSFPVFPTGDVDVEVRIYRPRRIGDVSNRIKVLEDALKGWAWTDDAQVRDLTIRRRDDKLNPRAEVEIHPVEAPLL
jgi:Holliday junction resolvase RusA-like endonuclease